MSNEELMKPRWKVIADYPGSDYHIGEILDRDWGWVGNDEIGFKHQVSHYPHLFKKLEWWEERDETNFPKYVKIEDRVIKVEKWIIEKSSVWMSLQYPEKSFTMGSKYYPPVFPATEEEYLSTL